MNTLRTQLSHPERVLFPHDAVTKLELADYFASVGEYALPHLARRPISILRQLRGATPFFQKHFLKKSGDGLRVVEIASPGRNSSYVLCESVAGLLHLAQLGAVELHTWGAVMPKPTHADRLTFDLDPDDGLAWSRVREGALAVRAVLRDAGLQSWVKTTGGKGLHVVAPLSNPLPAWAEAAGFAREVSRFLERTSPALFTSKRGERNRSGKIFVDYLRNGFGATAVAAFSPRWRPGVPVSVPVAWGELDRDLRGAHFNLRNVPKRVAKQRADPWREYWVCRQKMGSGPI